jgi:hypothetical protein
MEINFIVFLFRFIHLIFIKIIIYVEKINKINTNFLYKNNKNISYQIHFDYNNIDRNRMSE